MNLNRTLIFLSLAFPTVLTAQFSAPQVLLSPFPASDMSLDDVDGDGSLDFVLHGYNTFKWFSYDPDLQLMLPGHFTLDHHLEDIFSLHISDIDGDGDNDYVLNDRDNKQLAWLEKTDHQGSLKFHAFASYPYAGNREIRSGDIDQDGLMDIVVTSEYNIRKLSIYRQTAPQVFEEIVIDDTDRDFWNLRVRDMDGDGDLDIFVVSDHYNDRWTIYENRDGTGQDWQQHDVADPFFSTNGKGVKIGDIDQDGILDFIQLRCSGITWYRGLGNFTYERRVISEAHLCQSAVQLADLEGDGDLDLIVGNDSHTEPQTFILRFNGIGFDQEILSNTITSPRFVVHDFDKDGFAEILFGRRSWHRATADPADGRYKKIDLLAPSVYSDYTFHDLDGDADLDVIALGNQGIVALENIDPQQHLYNHIPRFYRPFYDIEPSAENQLFYARLFADPHFAGDEQLELFLALSNSSFENTGFTYFMQQTDDFSFGTATSVLEGEQLNYLFHPTDLNQDGWTDMVYFNNWTSRIERVLSRGDGTFGTPGFLISDIVQPRKITSADLDLDGDQDIFFDTGQRIQWIINDGEGSGMSFSTDYLSGSPRQLAAADMDLDGDVDFVKSYLTSNFLRILLNDGTGQFSRNERITSSEGFLLLDTDRNKSIDIITGQQLYRNTLADLEFEPLTVSPHVMSQFRTADFDGNGETDIIYNGAGNIYLIRNFFNDPMLEGYTFRDDNQNGQKDAEEYGLGNVKITIEGEEFSTTTYSGENGKFLLYTLPDGNYTISADSLENWSFTTEARIQDTIGTLHDTTYNFGYYPAEMIAEGTIDLNAQIIRCNQVVKIGFTVHNTGTTSPNFTLQLNYDPSLSFQQADIIPLQHRPDEGALTWMIQDLAPRQQLQVELYFFPLTEVQTGQELQFNAQLLNDLNTLDEATLKDTVRCSYDPNDKLVAPNRPDKMISASEKLLYTIRFQNTGNDTAFHITIRDTLDAFLNWKSLRPVSASHPYSITLHENIVEFQFRDIYLPDSTANLEASMGYVQFEIELKDSLQAGDLIRNKAAIFFDLNQPIITNTTTSELETVTSAIFKDIDLLNLKIFPNPTRRQIQVEFGNHPPGGIKHYTLTDLQGQLLQQQDQVGPKVEFDLDGLPAGAYLIRVMDQHWDLIGIGRFVKQ